MDSIVKAFKDNFLSADQLWIFGSRVDLAARGGDIDKIYAQKSKFVISLWKKIGEQRIDVVVKVSSDPLHLPIYDVAVKTGIKLV